MKYFHISSTTGLYIHYETINQWYYVHNITNVVYFIIEAGNSPPKKFKKFTDADKRILRI